MIADDLRTRIAAGEPAAGELLESESELCRSTGASRVTVRRALESLRAEGLVDARQGFGWFVATPPVRQHLAELGTIEAQLADAGAEVGRRVLDFAFVDADAHVARVLGTAQVLEVRRLNTADGSPFARVTVWCPAELATELSRADVERRPFVELLDVTLAGATQTIAAAAVTPADAALLGVPAGSPVLRVERVTADDRGKPVLVAEHVFPAHRTEFVVELTRPVDRADGEAAPGLRLRAEPLRAGQHGQGEPRPA